MTDLDATGDTSPIPSDAEIEGQMAIFTADHWIGPLPRPEALREYESVLQGSAERILAMTERDIAAQHRNQDEFRRGYLQTTKRGQWIAAILLIVMAVVSVVFFAKGNNIAGSAFIGLPIMFVIGSFITGSFPRSQSPKVDE